VLRGGHDGAVLDSQAMTASRWLTWPAALTDGGKPIAFVNLPESLAQALVRAGLPEPVATILADADARSGDGGV
jgi:NAD(P)H dehydrogenase (quinone)